MFLMWVRKKTGPRTVPCVVTANVSYKLEKGKVVEETHLLDSGRRLKMLNFTKAPWPEIQSELGSIDWSSMKDCFQTLWTYPGQVVTGDAVEG